MRYVLLLLAGALSLHDTTAALDDGAPSRIPCSSIFGDELTRSFGRMDGVLVAVVPPRQERRCNADPRHVHLQVMMHDAVYDVAVNVEALHAEIDAPLPGGAWSEGWHPGKKLDYARTLGVHAGDFSASAPEAMVRQIQSELVTANHISVFATGYGPGGGHLIHRNGSGRDGAIVVNPLSDKPHLLLFSFEGQSF